MDKRCNRRRMSRLGRPGAVARAAIGPIVEALEQRQFLSVGLDPTFGTNGVVSHVLDASFGLGLKLVDAQGLPGGKLLVAGSVTANPLTGDRDFFLARFDSDGKLDETFGEAGRVLTDFGGRYDQANALMLQPDGVILLAGQSSAQADGQDGDFALARYTSEGRLDLSFGTNGRVRMDLSGQRDSAQALALTPDGKILVGGAAMPFSDIERSILTEFGEMPVGSIFALVRMNADGLLDSSFGDGGKLATRIGSGGAGISALAVGPDGAIVAAGQGFPEGLGIGYDLALVRYQADGALDTTFGAGGKVTTSFGDITIEAVTSLSLMPDGRVVVGGQGYAHTAPGHPYQIPADGSLPPPEWYNWFAQRIVLARYQADGALDLTFGSQGQVTDGRLRMQGVSDLIVLPDGGILAAGRSETYLSVAAYNPDGTQAATFGTRGLATIELQQVDSVAGMALRDDGKLVVVAQAGGRIILARYLIDGQLLDPPVVSFCQLEDDTLMVIGTSGQDSISVGQNLDSSQITVTRNGIASQPFAAAQVKRIQIHGLDGDDTITLAGLSIPGLVRGGRGDDTITGGLGRDLIKGGEGQDSLRGGAGNDLLLGGEGDDGLWGEAGQDQLQGGLGHDQLFGGLGNDRLFGGEGQDTLSGEQGADHVWGGAGDDLLLARDSQRDRLRGGPGHDTPQADWKDDLLGINAQTGAAVVACATKTLRHGSKSAEGTRLFKG